MALLTAEDVHYKTFTPTKFREGYDQDEVDLFLDQVVATITALQEGGSPETGEADAALREENARLVAELEEARQAAAAAQSVPHDVSSADSDEVVRLQAELEGVRAELVQAQEENDRLRTALEKAEAAAKAEPAPQPMPEPESATTMLAMAQRLHDEYVNEGKQKSEQIVAGAHEESEQILREANAEKSRITEQLNNDRSLLEQKIEELKGFEREYREQIRGHLEKLIATVDGSFD